VPSPPSADIVPSIDKVVDCIEIIPPPLTVPHPLPASDGDVVDP
jgi:hypothetical protein